MSPSTLSKSFIVLFCATVLVTSPTTAQDTATTPDQTHTAQDAPLPDSLDLSLGEEVADQSDIGKPFIKETHGDWNIRCIKTENGVDPCQLNQLLKDGSGNAVAEISLFPLPAGQQAVAGATIATPLETLLTQQVTLSVDGGQPKRYPFTWCAQSGCFSRIGFSDADIAAFKRGSAGKITIVPVNAADTKVELEISLKGFTAGYDAIKDLLPK